MSCSLLSSCAPSTSGRCADLASATRNSSRFLLHTAAPSRPAAQRRLAAPQAVFGSSKNSLRNKYKSRQELEHEYFAEWDKMAVQTAEEHSNRRMTPLTLLRSIPNMLRFYVVPAPLRFLVFLVWVALQALAHRLRLWAVLAGARLDAATARRKGRPYELRAAALRRWHGKESLLQPLLNVVS